ncbi:MAG: TldD/PmbA family protein, partial [Gammaproteobacteria bacterium]|nr:TldD/PmbA family protein [Gammaproteobacteria bacterium]
MAEARGLSATDIRNLSERILRFSRADYCRVNITSGWSGYTRVATNRITSAGGSDRTYATITSVFGKRVAAVETNQLDDANLQQAVRNSEAMARLAPENPEYLPELGAQNYQSVSGYYDSTGDLEPLTRAEAAAIAIRQARAAGQVAASFMDVRAEREAVATSNGLFGSHAGTGVAYTLTCRSPDGLQSGWAGDAAGDWNNIESQRVADDAVSKCRDWRKTELEPGRYTAILEPTAVGMLMLRLLSSLNQRPADEGRSYFSRPGGGNRIGEALF